MRLAAVLMILAGVNTPSRAQTMTARLPTGEAGSWRQIQLALRFAF